jgi:hypothetical protein
MTRNEVKKQCTAPMGAGKGRRAAFMGPIWRALAALGAAHARPLPASLHVKSLRSSQLPLWHKLQKQLQYSSGHASASGGP